MLMARCPRTTPILTNLASVFAMVKWIYVAGSFVRLILALLAGLLVWTRARS